MLADSVVARCGRISSEPFGTCVEEVLPDFELLLEGRGERVSDAGGGGDASRRVWCNSATDEVCRVLAAVVSDLLRGVLFVESLPQGSFVDESASKEHASRKDIEFDEWWASRMKGRVERAIGSRPLAKRAIEAAGREGCWSKEVVLAERLAVRHGALLPLLEAHMQCIRLAVESVQCGALNLNPKESSERKAADSELGEVSGKDELKDLGEIKAKLEELLASCGIARLSCSRGSNKRKLSGSVDEEDGSSYKCGNGAEVNITGSSNAAAGTDEATGDRVEESHEKLPISPTLTPLVADVSMAAANLAGLIEFLAIELIDSVSSFNRSSSQGTIDRQTVREALKDDEELRGLPLRP